MRDVITVSLEHLWVSGEIDEDCNFIKCSVSPLWREQYMLEEFLSEGGFCLKNVFVLGSTFGGCPLLVAICLKIWALSLWCGSICITSPLSPRLTPPSLLTQATSFMSLPFLPGDSPSVGFPHLACFNLITKVVLEISCSSPWDSRTYTSSLLGFYSFENSRPWALLSWHHSRPWRSTQAPSCLIKVRHMFILISNAWCAKEHKTELEVEESPYQITLDRMFSFSVCYVLSQC